MGLLFSIAVDQGYFDTNPIGDIINKLNKQNNQKNRMRSSFVDKSLTVEEECDMVDDLIKEEKELGYVIAILLRLFTGLSHSEICALTWKDFHQVKSYDLYVLDIYKFFEDKSCTIIPYIDVNLVRYIPVATFLVSKIKKWKNDSFMDLDNYEVSSTDKGAYPLIHPSHRPMEPVTPDNLRNYSNKILDKYGCKDLFLGMADGTGSKKYTNVGKYGGDYFRSNFKYHGHKSANLSSGELCYLLGIFSKKTFERYYAGYMQPCLLLKMRDKLDSWAYSRISGFRELNRERHQMTITDKSKRVRYNPSTCSHEIVISIPDARGEEILLNLMNRLNFDVCIEWL